jgi:hypothetical protein
MRTFKTDGKMWIAKLHEDIGQMPVAEERVGWEAIQFDTDPPGQIQRITYRPAGWLNNATIQDLISALQEGDTVRANWRE